jgi:hypothetical protein
MLGFSSLSTSVLDPDPYPKPDWIRIQWCSGSRSAKMTLKNRKKVNRFYFLKYWMFSFEGFLRLLL